MATQKIMIGNNNFSPTFIADKIQDIVYLDGIGRGIVAYENNCNAFTKMMVIEAFGSEDVREKNIQALRTALEKALNP